MEAKRKRSDLHRRVTPGMKPDEVLCVHGEGAVARDWCVQWRGRLPRVEARHAALDLPRPGRQARVIEKLDGTLLLGYGDGPLTWSEVSRLPEKAKAAKKPV